VIAGALTGVRFGLVLSLAGVLLTPVAAVAGALAAWPFGADAGWTNTFFVANGFLSHWQVWCAFAVSVQLCALNLGRIPADASRNSRQALRHGALAQLYPDSSAAELAGEIRTRGRSTAFVAALHRRHFANCGVVVSATKAARWAGSHGWIEAAGTGLDVVERS